MSQTSTEVITESIGEEELEGIVDETVESDPVEHVVNIDGAAGSNTDSSETWRGERGKPQRGKRAMTYPSKDPYQ